MASDAPSPETWYDDGRRVPLAADPGAEAHRLFTRADGEGPWTTFWHGFPTSSWDWAPVHARLPGGRSRLYLDHLGFGDSDKPRDHAYSLHEQLDLALAAWDHHGVDETLLVVHDYSVSMAQELLARRRDGTWDGPQVAGIVLLNGGLFYSRQEPRPVQHLLRNRWAGPAASRLLGRRLFGRAFRNIFSDEHPIGEEDLDRHWSIIARRGGDDLAHRLIRYLDDREAHEARWTRALAQADVPLRFLWGPRDPVSGTTILEGVRAHRPGEEVTAWDDVGHYPQLEVPGRVAEAVADLEASLGPTG